MMEVTEHKLQAGNQRLNPVKVEMELSRLARIMINPRNRIGRVTLHY